MTAAESAGSGPPAGGPRRGREGPRHPRGGCGGLPRHPVRRAPGRRAALRRAAPVVGWSGVREALSYGPPPPQGGHFGMDALSPDAADDDWLTVNVWSPDPDPGAGLPVMVWIQGGGYVIGMSGLPEYDGGSARAGRRRRRGDVQLPRGDRGLRAARGGSGQPRAARPGRRPGVGARQHPRPSAATPTGSPSSASRRAGVGRRAAGDGPRGRALPPGRRAEHAGHVLLAGARRGHRRRLRRRAGAAAHRGRPVRRRPAAAVRRG